MSAKQFQKQSANTEPSLEAEQWQIDDLTRLKEQLLGNLISRTSDRQLQMKYRWAAEDAAALAFVTPFPSLFFPTLLSEKVAGARGWVKRQELIRRRCSPADLEET